MKRITKVLLFTVLIGFNNLYGQEGSNTDQQKTRFAGLHFGVVQPILAINDGTTKTIADEDFYTVGFPIGITFKTSTKLMFDLEFVPFINPGNDTTSLSTHLLFHPGILIPLNKGFTFGARAAFELGQGQIGFTPLLNKAFKYNDNNVFFIELVLPGRFGPMKDSGYTQVAALHFGIGI